MSDQSGHDGTRASSAAAEIVAAAAALSDSMKPEDVLALEHGPRVRNP